jgi:hypothetical protein
MNIQSILESGKKIKYSNISFLLIKTDKVLPFIPKEGIEIINLELEKFLKKWQSLSKRETQYNAEVIIKSS